MKLAEFADLSMITVSNIESGKFSPNLKNFIKITKVSIPQHRKVN